MNNNSLHCRMISDTCVTSEMTLTEIREKFDCLEDCNECCAFDVEADTWDEGEI